MTESIRDTSRRIHPSRNKKPVSDETCPPNLSVGSVDLRFEILDFRFTPQINLGAGTRV